MQACVFRLQSLPTKQLTSDIGGPETGNSTEAVWQALKAGRAPFPTEEKQLRR